MGLTILDAGVLIGVLNPNDPYHHPAHNALADHTHNHLALPASALAEILVAPARHSTQAVNTVRAFLDRYPITTLTLDDTTAITAAHLRAQHPRRLKLPDALVIATAHTHHANTLITTDHHWPPNTITTPTTLHTLQPQ